MSWIRMAMPQRLGRGRCVLARVRGSCSISADTAASSASAAAVTAASSFPPAAHSVGQPNRAVGFHEPLLVQLLNASDRPGSDMRPPQRADDGA